MIKGLSMNQRDRTALLIGSGVVILLLLIGGVMAARTMLGRLDRTIALRSQALTDIGRLRGEAQSLQQKIRQAEAKLSQPEGGSLLTMVEGLANGIGGQGNLSYLRPTASSARDGLTMETMELKLERQALQQVLRLLWGMENNPSAPMEVTSLRLQRRFDDHALLDATMTMNAYRK
jgi:general secretion pathway protein M